MKSSLSPHSPVANPSLVVASTSQSESNETLPTIVVAATMNFTDSSGSVQSLHPLTPVVVLDGVSDTCRSKTPM